MLAIDSLMLAAKRSAEYSERHYVLIGWVCLIAMPLSSYIESAITEPSFNTLGIRLSAGLLGIILIFQRKLPKKMRSQFHLMWISGVTYVLPFTFGVLLVLNSAYTPLSDSTPSLWIFQYLLALVFFVNLMHSISLATVLWAISAALSASTIVFVDKPNWDSVVESFVVILPVFLTAVFIGSLTNRNVSMVQTEKLRAASAIGANLAHELRTPLASIGALSKGTENLLPILTDAYDKAKQAGLELQPLRPNQLSLLTKSLSTIRNEVEYSNTIIDMLLVNTADKSLSDVDTEFFSVQEAATEAIQRYPFNNQREKVLIRTDIQHDFQVEAPRLLIVHVLFNLMKNALYSVQKAGKGDICIRAEQRRNGGCIVVHDTGMGISPSARNHIFERFYTTTQTVQSAGIGLSFCKLVMESFGGDIRCASEEGKYTTFTLDFPNAKS